MTLGQTFPASRKNISEKFLSINDHQKFFSRKSTLASALAADNWLSKEW
jgi:hypothetical protein